MKESESCPHCHTRSGLCHYYTLLFSLEHWPLALLASLVVLAFGEKLAFSSSWSSGFIAFAVLPFLFSIIHKRGCENCGAEFRDREGETVRSPLP